MTYILMAEYPGSLPKGTLYKPKYKLDNGDVMYQAETNQVVKPLLTLSTIKKYKKIFQEWQN